MKTQTLFLVATALIGLASCQGRLEKAQDVSKHPRSERVLQVSTVGYQILGVDLDGELSELVIDSVEADPQITGEKRSWRDKQHAERRGICFSIPKAHVASCVFGCRRLRVQQLALRNVEA